MASASGALLRHADDLGDISSSSTSTTLADLWSQSSDFDDDDTDDDRTSRSSSIPWAEETVEENRQLWQSIEEMLYGERPLPADGPLRTELQQWQQHRPHLRCRGTAVSVSGFYGGPTTMAMMGVGCGGGGVVEQREEVLAIHPPPAAVPVPMAEPLRAKRIVPRTAAETTTASREAAEMLEHCLRISSSAWYRRPITTHSTAMAAARHRRRRLAADAGAELDPIVCATARRADVTDNFRAYEPDIRRLHHCDEVAVFDEDDAEDADADKAFVVNRLRPLKMPPVFRVRPFHSRLDLRPSPPLPPASMDEQHQHQRWSPAGSAAAIRRRTILPPIDDRRTSGGGADGAVRRPVVIVGGGGLRHHRDERAMGDLFGRSVSAVYVPSLNI